MEKENPFGNFHAAEDEGSILGVTDEVSSSSNSKIRISIGKSPLQVCENLL